MMFHAHAPASLWFDAFTTAVFVINRIPTSILHDKSPFELLFGYAPNYVNFKLFGCRVYSYLRDYSGHKLVPRSYSCIFLGYISLHKSFYCLDPDTSRVYITRHAQFDELQFPFFGTPSSREPTSLDLSNFLENMGMLTPMQLQQPPHATPRQARSSY